MKGGCRKNFPTIKCLVSCLLSRVGDPCALKVACPEWWPLGVMGRACAVGTTARAPARTAVARNFLRTRAVYPQRRGTAERFGKATPLEAAGLRE